MTRKSKREIERKVNELDTTPYDDYPVLDNLAMLLGYDWEEVEGGERLRRRKDTGQLYYYPEQSINIGGSLNNNK
jgi:hypothetical protein